MLVEVLTNIIITAFLVIVPAWYASKREIPMKKVFLILWGICATILSGIDLWLLHELEWISLILSGILSTVFNFACFQHPERQKIYFRSIFVLFFFFFASLFQLIPVFLFSIDLNHMSLRMDSYLSLFSNTCLAICLLFLYRHDLKEEFLVFKKNFMKNMDIGFRYWFLGLVIMVSSNLLIQFFVPSANAGNEQAVQSLIQAAPWMSFLSTGLLAPVVEEITFRKTFRDLFHNDTLFIWVSGLVFGGLHVVLSLTSFSDFAYLIPYCSLGISFGYIYAKTKSVYTSMSMHLFHNVVLSLLSIVASMVIVL